MICIMVAGVLVASGLWMGIPGGVGEWEWNAQVGGRIFGGEVVSSLAAEGCENGVVGEGLKLSAT